MGNGWGELPVPELTVVPGFPTTTQTAVTVIVSPGPNRVKPVAVQPACCGPGPLSVRAAALIPVSVPWLISLPVSECFLICRPVSVFGLIRRPVIVCGLKPIEYRKGNLQLPAGSPYVPAQLLAISSRISLPFSFVPSRNSTVRSA
jgi:hypothetical protein